MLLYYDAGATQPYGFGMRVLYRKPAVVRAASRLRRLAHLSHALARRNVWLPHQVLFVPYPL